MAKKLTPHQKIMRAAAAGKGLRLSSDEVWYLSCDGAIETRADWDDHPEDEATDRDTRHYGTAALAAKGDKP